MSGKNGRNTVGCSRREVSRGTCVLLAGENPEFLRRQLTVVMLDSILYTVGYMLVERYCSAV